MLSKITADTIYCIGLRGYGHNEAYTIDQLDHEPISGKTSDLKQLIGHNASTVSTAELALTSL